MKVAIYARVSTSDKGQTVETQLLPLREFSAAQGWAVAGEYIDEASALDHNGRVAWRRLLDDASKKRIDIVLLFRIDRAFRSVLDAAQTLERLRSWKVGLRSYCEPWLDTTSPFGEALYYITSAYAQLERGILVERVKSGMDRARRQGVHVGRPRKVNGEWGGVRARILSGELSQREAAAILGVGRATIARLLARKGPADASHEPHANRRVS